ncbi:hypothetical protein GCM10011507_29020 [Edaphobacter acidisoli]|uniref:Uncharacterized protein n=1 Tax=Edaphobacter acidisoli TaxID=2040573 RepID=A0A916RYR2_9BACT|nr:hypothetical protein GCM10011507_29020 [Edaphobacter acidisoli]
MVAQQSIRGGQSLYRQLLTETRGNNGVQSQGQFQCGKTMAKRGAKGGVSSE